VCKLKYNNNKTHNDIFSVDEIALALDSGQALSPKKRKNKSLREDPAKRLQKEIRPTFG
jgi:hypothetical protein